MKFEIENSVIASYKRLSYEPWYAFAEFVDNSTQSYLDFKSNLDSVFDATGEKLTISIEYNKSEDKIIIEDNSIGMNEEDLVRAFKVGQPPLNPNGRSKYGLGMKTAACWFGDNWKITTKKLGCENAFEIEIDVDSIAKQIGDVDLNPKILPAKKEEHYTILSITNLNRKFIGKTLWKIRDFLSSIYRFDLADGVIIKWNGATLVWHGYEDELYVTTDGIKAKKTFAFNINNKPVEGWVGVLGRGFASRKKAGFSIIQNKRVIQNGFKPSSLFGDQEDGGNDLVNQRLTGELFLDKFSVSHTKDKIIWEDEEEDLLNAQLGDFCKDLRELALTARFKQDSGINYIDQFKEEAITILSSEFKSREISDYISTFEPYPEKIIMTSFHKTLERVLEEYEPDIRVNIGDANNAILVSVYFSEKSEFEPYVLIETTVIENKVIVIINILHPHVQDMNSADSFTNFIRHSVYDGVAEWKAIKLRGVIQPFTIKLLKDGLLRIPFEIKLHKAI
jgi:hypothetical protein